MTFWLQVSNSSINVGFEGFHLAFYQLELVIHALGKCAETFLLCFETLIEGFAQLFDVRMKRLSKIRGSGGPLGHLKAQKTTSYPCKMTFTQLAYLKDTRTRQ